MNIIDQNSVLKKYSFKDILTDDDNQQAMTVIDSMIEEKNFFTKEIVFSKNNVIYCNGLPSYQTRENLLSRNEFVWLKFQSTFLTAAITYLNKKIKIVQYSAWGFMTNNSIATDRDKYWHHHHLRKENEQMISGIYYLKIPDDENNIDTSGTEFALNGQDYSNTVFVKPDYYTWLIHPSNLYHRPGIWSGNNYRYVLAADLIYKDIN
jgi:hypothetical protein